METESFRDEPGTSGKKIDLRLIFWGIGLIGAGILAPYLIGVRDFGIPALMEKSIAQNSSDSLLFASVRLVVLNTLRALPHYLGVLFIVEGLGVLPAARSGYRLLLPLLLIPAVYQAIRLIYGISYDLGTPAAALILAIMIMARMRDMGRNPLHKIPVFSLLLFGVEWLDIVPKLNGFGFGRGVVSQDIKRISLLIDAQDTLDFIGISLFIIFVANAVLTARLLSVYTKEIKAVETAWHLEHMATELEMRALENRSLREIQSLVHDLKTPLTTIQGLGEVLRLQEDHPEKRGYAEKITDAAEKMSRMISELLRDDIRQAISVKELVEYAVAHVPAIHSLPSFQADVAEGLPQIRVNKIKMCRALVNLLENALEAVDPEKGAISIRALSAGRWVRIQVIDNGPGVAAEDQGRIWDAGFSTKNSSGLGLLFVRDTVEGNEGQIQMENSGEKGTVVTIFLPGVERNGQ